MGRLLSLSDFIHRKIPQPVITLHGRVPWEISIKTCDQVLLGWSCYLMETFCITVRLCSFSAAVKPVAVECNPPVLSTVAVDEPHHRYYPYFIRLHRCEGSYGYESPNIKKCVVTESREVTFSVYDTTNRLSTQIRLQNHTKCGPECKASPLDCDLKVQEWNDESCQCKCLYPRSPPPDDVVKPKKGFGWVILPQKSQWRERSIC